ncbi:MAG: hypothetical protein AAF902_26440 [Chloroflexota bacterium]
MTDLIIKGVDNQLLTALENRDSESGVSVNSLILQILSTHVDKAAGPKGKYHDLDHLAGTWTEQEFEEFNSALKWAGES